MASASKTPNLNLPQWVGTEKPERTDFSAAFDAIDTTVASHLAESASKHITESGSNANGSYIKFDDGTMICTKSEHGFSPITTGYAVITWVFPAEFIDANYYYNIEVGGANSTDSQKIKTIPMRSTDNDTTQASVYLFTTANMLYAATVYRIAIGRWK